MVPSLTERRFIADGRLQDCERAIASSSAGTGSWPLSVGTSSLADVHNVAWGASQIQVQSYEKYLIYANIFVSKYLNFLNSFYEFKKFIISRAICHYMHILSIVNMS